MKILTVVGARPQFIKASALNAYIREHSSESVSEVVVHTGQHYDRNMSDVFFETLGMSKPSYRLKLEGASHGAMTAGMLRDIEQLIELERPDTLLVYGDTNSTLAGALAAAKLHIPVAHVEAGLRSFNKRMPEEINRILTDHVSDVLYCPTLAAMNNLEKESLADSAVLVGDIMFDAFQRFSKREPSSYVKSLLDGCKSGFVLATIHRADNTDDISNIFEICSAFGILSTSIPVLFPVHPRTEKIISDNGFRRLLGNTQLLLPCNFLDMVQLLSAANCVVTDSGGLQKEAYFAKTPCITIRGETEWKETVDLGWNRLVPTESEKIVGAVSDIKHVSNYVSDLYGSGNTSELIVEDLKRRY